MALSAHLDYETFSEINLKMEGSYKYASDPSTDVLCASWAIGEDEISTWFPWETPPEKLMEHIRAGGLVTAHNSSFESAITEHVLAKNYGWVLPKLSQYRCTAAKAAAMALPRSLDGACGALGIPFRKTTEGSRLLMKMCKLSPAGKRTDSKELRLELARTRCEPDVQMERALDKRLFDLSAFEQKIFYFDAIINRRGVRIDVESAVAAQKIVQSEGKRFARAIQEATSWRVMSQNQRGKIVEWIEDQGVEIFGLTKQDVDGLLKTEGLPEHVRTVLELRQESAKTSTAKVDKMLKWVEPDGRMRGNLLYHGAGTGRWAGKGPQLQNLPRPSQKFEEIDTEQLMFDIRGMTPEQIAKKYYSPINLVSDAVRSFIVADKGNTLIAADYSNIESRVLPFLAREESALEGFRKFDRGEGADIYKIEIAKIYGIPVEAVASLMRLQGKVVVLACGFQGGVGALQRMAATYGITLAPAFESLWDVASAERRQDVERAYALYDGNLSWEEWAASEMIKRSWRDGRPLTVQYWRDAEEAAVNAVRQPGALFKVGYCSFLCAHNFLWCRLPSGRTLAYAYPSLKRVKMPWTRTTANGEQEPVYKQAVCFWGTDAVTKPWGETTGYGGLFVENMTQAVARDIMAYGMLGLETAGYPIVLSVHDEIISEVPKGFGSLEEFCSIMCTTPKWATGLPVVAEGWVGGRYHK